MFFPRRGRRRMRLTVKRIDGEWVRGIREDGSEVNLALDRLLARDAAGGGIHYRFLGWRLRPRGYRTELRVHSVSPAAGRCSVRLPEWDPETEVELSLASLPEELRRPNAAGSCMANLASPSVGGLDIHSCRRGKVRDASRQARGPHPDVLAEGQVYRRRRDGVKLRLLDVDGPRISAWNGRRVVRISAAKLLETRADGGGRNYEYLGGGIAGYRKRPAISSRRSGFVPPIIRSKAATLDGHGR